MHMRVRGDLPRLRGDQRRREPPSPRGQAIIGAAALLCAAWSVVFTLQSEILRYPGWLALQRVDVSLGTVAIGLYWWRRRPASRLGPVLVLFGFVSVPMTLQGSSTPFLYSLGVFADAPYFLTTLYVLLAFPTGHLRGRIDRAIVLAASLVAMVTFVPRLFLAPHIAGGGPLAVCRGACPANGWLIADHPEIVSALGRVQEWGATILLVLATAVVLVVRYLRGTPPQRRSLAAGLLTGAAFCLVFASFHLVLQVAPGQAGLLTALQWALVLARDVLVAGLLVAVASGEMYGGRLLARFVSQSLDRRATADLERTIATALHDPALKLAFWNPDLGVYADAEGVEVVIPSAGSGRVLTEVERDGRKAAAILHDEQLREGPELIQAAGAAALLAYENARLEDSLGHVIGDLRDSRARLAAAGDSERRRLERNLHDGAQQQFVAARFKLALAQSQAPGPALADTLADVDADLGRALDALRDLAHGIYPAVLADAGLGPALAAIADRADGAVQVSADVGRFPLGIESAVYFCALEALQNVSKHAGPDATPAVVVQQQNGSLVLTVEDNGRGFETAMPGDGLRNMRDRIGAVGGEVSVESQPGRGTVVLARVPLA
jgi:signal transduction histidine kinase